MTRETKELTTTSGKKATIYAYLTAREMQAINTAAIGDQKTDAADGGRVSLPLSAGVTWENKVLEAAITSFDGITEKPIEKALDLPSDEYADLKAQIYAQLKINLKQPK